MKELIEQFGAQYDEPVSVLTETGCEHSLYGSRTVPLETALCGPISDWIIIRWFIHQTEY
ncbi:MAG: hypothetical protein ETSY2_19280 [Candidatus Entotheonella gemina]|uniref:Uncharacterized protein n=1 Tax=Candidatus Entotheonella gemina TaxID=1429439 RepID=W4M8V9_9BACT|nr:MAG: hypothetical protein ETSY2_19280 [Candidatus Entotheonella gemina]